MKSWVLCGRKENRQQDNEKNTCTPVTTAHVFVIVGFVIPIKITVASMSSYLAESTKPNVPTKSAIRLVRRPGCSSESVICLFSDVVFIAFF